MSLEEFYFSLLLHRKETSTIPSKRALKALAFFTLKVTGVTSSNHRSQVCSESPPLSKVAFKHNGTLAGKHTSLMT